MTVYFRLWCVVLSCILNRVLSYHSKHNTAIQKYTNICGNLLCNEEHETIEGYPVLCRSCSCSSDCIVRKKCCMDFYFQLPDRVCRSEVIYYPPDFNKSAHQNEAMVEMIKFYNVVEHCPNTSSVEVQKKCTADFDLKEKISSLPVTSSKTNITYRNVHCAKCNNESNNIENWQLSFRCMSETDFNICSSVDEMVAASIDNNCVISTFAKKEIGFEKCRKNRHVAITSCNTTGTWKEKNDEIVQACQKIDQPIGMYQNIFCYICNPPIGELEIITNCLTDSPYYDRCMVMPFDQTSYPYKNVYTFMNNVNKSNEMVTKMLYNGTSSLGFHKLLVFTLSCTDGFVLGESNTQDIWAPSLHLRPWQYTIECRQLEVFSLFYSKEQLQEEAERRQCTFLAASLNNDLKCLDKKDLIRTCNVPAYVYNGKILKDACLHLEDENLLAYKGYYNMFCYWCENPYRIYSEFCIPENKNFGIFYDFDAYRCEDVLHTVLSVDLVFCQMCSNFGPIPGAGYRRMFSLSSYENSIERKLDSKCSENQLIDKKKNLCRNILCYPGKRLQNGECVNFMNVSEKLCYRFAADFKINLMETNESKTTFTLMSILSDRIFGHLEKHLNIKFTTSDFELNYMISNNSCDDVQGYVKGHNYIQFCINDFVDRLNIESNLLKMLESSFTVRAQSSLINIEFTKSDQAYEAPMLIHDQSLKGKCILYKEQNNMWYFRKLITTYYRVNKLLLCTQVEFSVDEYKKSPNGYIEIYNATIGPNEYVEVKTGVRICTEKLFYLLTISNRKDLDLILFGIRVFCLTTSLICLLCTFITYSLFKRLRTLPGINNMVLVFCLILNGAVFYVRLFDTPSDAFCKVVGVLQQFFFLSCFTSFNICSYHIYRVFASKVIFNKIPSISILCKYWIYIFFLPLFTVIFNSLITRFIYKQSSLGYGGKLCFIILEEAVVYTLLCPIGLIMFINILFFVAALYHICSKPNLSSGSSTRARRNDFVIFLKLFTITGCTWMFQLIDSFFPESFFSVLVSICSLLTGLFIFMSYICNERVLNMYKESICSLITNSNSSREVQKELSNKSCFHTCK